MEQRKLQITMLGEYSVVLGDLCIQDSGKRVSKAWLLLAYLLCNRNRMVPQEELMSRLWGSDSEEGRSGVLKTSVWRARQMLQAISEAMGAELIVSRDGSYGWNADIPAEVDVEQFERLCREAAVARSEDEKREKLRSGLALYRGDLLAKFSSEEWVEPVAAFYYNLYIDSVMELLALLPLGFYAEEAAELCRAALRTAPYHEVLYQHLMQALAQQKEYTAAEEVYEEMQQVLQTNLGVMPGEESQAIFREIRRQAGMQYLTSEMIREQLSEKDPLPGPFFCDYSVFKLFYQTEARSAFRRGDAVHVGVLSVKSADGKELSQAALERAMEQLRARIQNGLRSGDVVARCSSSQYIVMLLQANFENSSMVCKRLTYSFMQAHPRSPVRIHCTILPLEPLQGSVPGRELSLADGGRPSWNI